MLRELVNIMITWLQFIEETFSMKQILLDRIKLRATARKLNAFNGESMYYNREQRSIQKMILKRRSFIAQHNQTMRFKLTEYCSVK